MSYALIWLASAVVLAVAAIFVRQPGYMDAYYYYHIATNLASGRGMVESFIWNYLSPPDSIVHPSNLYWMPLTSLAAVPFMLVLGTSFRATQVPFVVIGATAPVLSFYLGRDIFGNRRTALGMAALTLFSGFYFVYWTAIDSFGLFSLLVNLALIVGYKIARRLRRGDMLAGASARAVMGLCFGYGALSGGAYLARADGPLLLFTLPVMVLLVSPRRKVENSLASVGLMLAGFAVVVAPWLWRNLEVAGVLLPGGALKTLFLTEYNDFFSYAKELSLSSYLEWGWREIIWSKLQALARNPLVLFGIEYYLLPFAVVGVWQLRRRLEYWPVFVYGMLLYLVMSLVFSFVSGRGSMLHSSVVLLPWLAGAAIYGLDACVVWIARRRRHWNVPLAQRNLTVMMALFAFGMSATLFGLDVGGRDARYSRYNELASWFAERGEAKAVVMLVDPPAYYYSSGQPAIVLPSDGPDAAMAAGARYGARFLVLEKLHSRAYEPLYSGEEQDERLQLVATLGEAQVYVLPEVSGLGVSEQ
ncbi:MAG: hypothetical protein EPO21_19155 [Chloroflexota bacterium]|nr:MAG: hypothetical protein EPO21_19155 [Chloroflexota bacterium]